MRNIECEVDNVDTFGQKCDYALMDLQAVPVPTTHSLAIPTAKDIAQSITRAFCLDQLPPDFRHEILAELVGACCSLPSYSTLKRAEISLVAKATVGTGVVPIFIHPETGEWNALVVRPGTHYQNPYYGAQADVPYYMIGGGFINLSCKPGVSENEAPDLSRAEHPNEGAVRELREEIVDAKGVPILIIDATRLRPVDTLTLSFKSGEKRVVIGSMVELSDVEITRTLTHVYRVKTDPEYRRASRQHTINSESGKPEICQADVLPLRILVSEDTVLLHRDQRGLFRKIFEMVSPRVS